MNHQINGLTFFSLGQHSACIEQGDGSKIIQELLDTFSDIYLSKEDFLLIKWTSENKKLVDSFVANYSSEFPQIKQLRKYLCNLPDGHYFIAAYGKVQNSETSLEYSKKLIHVHRKEQTDVSTYKEYNVSPLGIDLSRIVSKYDVSVFGQDRTQKVGENKKESRVCRFCKKSEGEINKFESLVTFKSKSHAFSQALGNTQVICNEECDFCNSRFGDSIELSFLNLHLVTRALHQFKGKGGVKKLMGKNFSINQGTIDVIYDDTLGIEFPKNFRMSLELSESDKFIPQDFYRCLCKFVLSVIDPKNLNEFSRTLEWINGDFYAEKLPPISTLQDTRFFCDQPNLSFFIRKSDDLSYPNLVGEFHYADLVYVFIVPFCLKDRCDFTETLDYNKFVDIFLKSRPSYDWKQIHFDSTEKVKISINLTIG